MFDNFYILFLCTANTAATAAAEILASHSSAATAGAAEDTALEVATRVSCFCCCYSCCSRLQKWVLNIAYSIAAEVVFYMTAPVAVVHVLTL